MMKVDFGGILQIFAIGNVNCTFLTQPLLTFSRLKLELLKHQNWHFDCFFKKTQCLFLWDNMQNRRNHRSSSLGTAIAISLQSHPQYATLSVQFVYNLYTFAISKQTHTQYGTLWAQFVYKFYTFAISKQTHTQYATLWVQFVYICNFYTNSSLAWNIVSPICIHLQLPYICHLYTFAICIHLQCTFKLTLRKQHCGCNVCTIWLQFVYNFYYKLAVLARNTVNTIWKQFHLNVISMQYFLFSLHS